LTITGCFINAYIMLPLYSEFMPIESIIAQGAAIWPAIDSTFMFVLLCVAPFNFLKGILNALVAFILYKRISHLIKK
ncbi:MAG: ECF transporter S component, partial [Clostridia bacterium]|nr:ECF transporter S component [Clostridia bacterium]